MYIIPPQSAAHFPAGVVSASRTMDTIFLKELRVETVVGVFEWEQRVRQTVLIDLEMAVDAAAAAQKDELSGTLDYKAISKRVKDFAENNPCALIETLAQGIADILLGEFDVSRAKVTVSKPGAIRGAKTVGVSVTRRKQTSGT